MVTKRYARAQRQRIIELEDQLNAANAYIVTKNQSYEDLAAENEQLRGKIRPLHKLLSIKVKELVTTDVELERLRSECETYQAALRQISDGEDPMRIARQALEPS